MTWYLEEFVNRCESQPKAWFSVCGSKKITYSDFICAVDQLFQK